MGFDSLNFIESRIILNQIHNNSQPRFRAKAHGQKRKDATNAGDVTEQVITGELFQSENKKLVTSVRLREDGQR
jgi:hypothetical protein